MKCPARWLLTIAILGVGCSHEALLSPEHDATLAIVGGVQVRFKTITAAESHTCVTTKHNDAYCWGENDNGQLGDGTRTDRSRPVQVAGGLAFRWINAGTHHTCGIGINDKRAYCWGSNSEGQLGDGTTTDRLTPTAVTLDEKFRRIAAGKDYTCGITRSGFELYCWGNNSRGQLGDGTTTSRLVPTAVVSNLKFSDVVASEGVVSPNSSLDRHTCALTTHGSAYCWGSLGSGQVGNGVLSPSLQTTPTAVLGGHNFRRITAGIAHTCAVSKDRRLYCWGSNGNGQLGIGCDPDCGARGGPQLVSTPDKVRGADAGSFHTCFTTAGSSFCMGSNQEAQIGDGTIQPAERGRLFPTEVVGGFSFARIAAGRWHSCAITDDQLSVYCWGDRDFGQAGDGSVGGNVLSPTEVLWQ